MEDKTYTIRDNTKELVAIFNKDYTCPYCGTKVHKTRRDDNEGWLQFNGASGYGSHFSDSDLKCRECGFGVPVTSMRQPKTAKGHYARMQDYAKGRYAYLLKEHNTKAKSLAHYKVQLDKYIGDTEGIDLDA